MDRTEFPFNIDAAEKLIRSDVDAWHAGHIRKNHPGTFYACLNPDAPIFYNGPVYCPDCMRDAMPPPRTPWHVAVPFSGASHRSQ